jgi:ketosteroid isomerase-like protein
LAPLPSLQSDAITEEHDVSTHTDIVDAYMEGFRRSDKPAILALLTDDVAWDLPGFRHLQGKTDFEGEIVNPQFEENPTLVVDRKLEAGDTVVCIGEGQGQMKAGGEFRFAFCDVFTFRDDLIRRVESYVVPLSGPSLADLAEG